MAESANVGLGEPAIGPIRQGRFNGVRIESIVGRSLGLIAVLFAVQSVPVMMSQMPAMHQLGALILNALLLLALLSLAASTLSSRFVQAVTTTFAMLFIAAIIAWPALVAEPEMLQGQAPWIWYLCTVATAAAAVGMQLYWAVAYTITVPVLYGMLRTSPGGGGVEPPLAALDGLYVVILGGLVLVIITMLRHAAVQVDLAQQAAMDAYAMAVREHATALERAQVDAIVHDSVLTTLLAAAGSGTAHEQRLAAVMASGAVARLDEAGVAAAPLDAEVALTRIVRRLKAAAQAFSQPVEIRAVGVNDQLLPLPVAEAFYSATVQAMVNSMQHAGTESEKLHRAVTVFGSGVLGCRIEITDNGRGFEPGITNRERLGLRISITERVRNVGGIVEVRSRPGRGTAVALAWSADAGGRAPQ